MLGLFALKSTATRAIPGTTSLSNSSRLPLRSTLFTLKPVTLPPGRARLGTRPECTGSAIRVITMGTVQRGLQQLVEAEFLYQQGLPPEATYLFKHALIQETAYQSLLRSTRQQYH